MSDLNDIPMDDLLEEVVRRDYARQVADKLVGKLSNKVGKFVKQYDNSDFAINLAQIPYVKKETLMRKITFGDLRKRQTHSWEFKTKDELDEAFDKLTRVL